VKHVIQVPALGLHTHGFALNDGGECDNNILIGLHLAKINMQHLAAERMVLHLLH
jgi:hypothetical protein